MSTRRDIITEDMLVCQLAFGQRSQTMELWTYMLVNIVATPLVKGYGWESAITSNEQAVRKGSLLQASEPSLS